MFRLTIYIWSETKYFPESSLLAITVSDMGLALFLYRNTCSMQWALSWKNCCLIGLSEMSSPGSVATALLPALK